jgi:hypothetical protein
MAHTDKLNRILQRFSTAEKIGKTLTERYPDVEDIEFNIDHSEFVHEHTMTSIGVILISSLGLGTTTR